MPCKQLPTVHRDVRLDSIRGIGVLLVVFSHLLIPDISPRNFADQLFNVFTDVFKFIRTGGWIGVDLFFVLSGFLVSGLLFREFELTGKISMVSFLIRRGLKIYPVFYSFLLLFWLITCCASLVYLPYTILLVWKIRYRFICMICYS